MTAARRSALATAACAAALLLPFSDKALHVDDPFYLWVAEQIRAEPADFYGATVNWYGAEQSVAQVNQNPPLVSYYIALWSAALGTSERALHLTFLLPALALVLGVHALARRLGARPWLAALATLATPVALVSATTLMSDVPMLALYVWAVFFWTRGVDEASARDCWIAAGLAALCALTKYFGATLVPLLAAHALIARARPVALVPLALPVAALVAWEVVTTAMYGAPQLRAAADFALREGGGGGLRWALGAVFAGGGCATLALFAPFLATRRMLAAGGAAALALGGALAALDSAGSLATRLHVAAFGAAGAALAKVAASELLARRDAANALLALWSGGTVVFAVALNWTTNGRALLPLAPPLALLVARRIARVRNPWLAPRPARLAVALGAAAALSLVVAQGDAASAAAARDAARLIHERYAAARIWFVGHWGFQHYMQRRGARPVDFRRSEISAGDVIVVPELGHRARWPADGTYDALERIAVPQEALAATMGDGAGFYAAVFGPLPYRLGRPSPQVYDVLRARRPFHFLPPHGTWASRAAELARAADWRGVLDLWERSGRALAMGPFAVSAAYAAGEPERAAAAIRELTAAAPDSATMHRELARAARAAGDAATAAPLEARAGALEEAER